MRIWLEKLHLDLKVNWKLSRNQTAFKENYLVHLETDSGSYRSEIAPNIRYGETPLTIAAQFEEWRSSNALDEIKDIPSLTRALDKKPLQHALRFGLESVFISAIAGIAKSPINLFLGLGPLKQHVPTSFSMPILPIGEIGQYLEPIGRFQSLKIKVNPESALEMLQEIHKHTKVRLRIDGNEGWKNFDDFMSFQAGLTGMNVELIEQPFPSHMHEAYRELKRNTPYCILADESIEDVGDFTELARQFHAVNIKLMKTGSLLRARDLIVEAGKHQLKTMMGCMIETSVGISYGMHFAGLVDYVDLDGFLLIKDEPFQLVSETEGLLSVSSHLATALS